MSRSKLKTKKNPLRFNQVVPQQRNLSGAYSVFPILNIRSLIKKSKSAGKASCLKCKTSLKKCTCI